MPTRTGPQTSGKTAHTFRSAFSSEKGYEVIMTLKGTEKEGFTARNNKAYKQETSMSTVSQTDHFVLQNICMPFNVKFLCPDKAGPRELKLFDNVELTFPLTFPLLNRSKTHIEKAVKGYHYLADKLFWDKFSKAHLEFNCFAKPAKQSKPIQGQAGSAKQTWIVEVRSLRYSNLKKAQ